MRFKEIKKLITETEILDEIRMNPKSLQAAAEKIDARVGMEFELIVPGNYTEDDDENFEEPDYGEDRRGRSISDVVDFFEHNGINRRRDLKLLEENLLEEFVDWRSEKVDNLWSEDGNEFFKKWLRENVDESEWKDKNETFDEYFENVWIDKYTNDYYTKAKEEFEEENNDDYEDSLFIKERYPTMQHVQREFDIEWPYYTLPDRRSTDDLNDLASTFSSEVGMGATSSTNYHDVSRRNQKGYIIEPDGSIHPEDSNETGLEFVSPPLSIQQMGEQLRNVVKFCKRHDCYTNESTGLHINVSVPDYDKNKLDYVKLVLLLGDDYIADQFNRLGNSYAQSAMQKIKDRVAKADDDTLTNYFKVMRQGMSDLASQWIHSPNTSKYTSVNVKENRIEFRSPGNDWLSGSVDENIDKVLNTMYRFVIVLDAATKPDLYKEEYLKKLYKMLAPTNNEDPLYYFARYSVGALDKAELKELITRIRTAAKLAAGKSEPGKLYVWRVTMPGHYGTANVVADSKENAIKLGREKLSPGSSFSMKAEVMSIYDPAKHNQIRTTQPEPSVAEPSVAEPTGSDSPQQEISANGAPIWQIYELATGNSVWTFSKATQQEAMDYAQQWIRNYFTAHGGLGLRPKIATD